MKFQEHHTKIKGFRRRIISLTAVNRSKIASRKAASRRYTPNRITRNMGGNFAPEFDTCWLQNAKAFRKYEKKQKNHIRNTAFMQ